MVLTRFCGPAATFEACVRVFVNVFMHAYFGIEKPAKVQPVLAVKCNVFAVGFAGGLTPTPVHFWSREQQQPGLYLKAKKLCYV